MWLVMLVKSISLKCCSLLQDLHHDATRDLRALGSHINIINNCQELDRETKVFGLSKEMQEGVLFMCAFLPIFTTYATSFVVRKHVSSSFSGLQEHLVEFLLAHETMFALCGSLGDCAMQDLYNADSTASKGEDWQEQAPAGD